MEVPYLFLGIILAVGGNHTYYNSLYQFEISSDDVAVFAANGTLARTVCVANPCGIEGHVPGIEHEFGKGISATNPCVFQGSTASYCTRERKYAAGRLLPAEYNKTSDDVFDPRLAASGKALPPCRKLRQAALSDGNVPDLNITSLALHILVGFATDSATTSDTTNYVYWRTTCCTDAGKSEPMCYPLAVPDDDRIHRFNNIRCLNMTRPQTYATSGCCPNTTTPLRIVGATPLPDLSHIYGNVEDGRRSYSGGNLSVEYINGRVFPNQTGINLLLGINFFGIVFNWRWHNHFATQLAALNPCWSDDKLFWTAREMNIAAYNQILFYELWPLFLGKDRMIADGIISNCNDFRDVYDNTTTPKIYNEYMIALRKLHTLQDGQMRLFDSDGNYLKSFPATNLTTDINYIKQDDNMDGLTQSCFRQAAANSRDSICDSDMMNKGLGMLQLSSDILANDLCKSRLQGIPSFTKYRYLCFGDNITCFDDLKDIITPEGIEIMKENYENVTDVDLIFALWHEILYTDAFVSPTFYCIVSKQLYEFVVSDRFHYERADRPGAFTADQLAQIRNVTVARMLCDVGDAVTEIQPKAFELISDCNPLTSCSDIPDIDYTPWYDDTCATTTS